MCFVKCFEFKSVKFINLAFIACIKFYQLWGYVLQEFSRKCHVPRVGGTVPRVGVYFGEIWISVSALRCQTL